MSISQSVNTPATHSLDTLELRYCSRCIYDDSTPAIAFDAEGVCNYCHMIDQLAEEYGTGTTHGE